MTDTPSGASRFLCSTIGRKVLMAVTGLVLFGFLVGHVSGNLLVFAGAEKMDAYAKFLHDNQGLLWGTRVVLLASVLVHIGAWIRLLRLRRAARPVGYASLKPVRKNLGTRTMAVTGPIVLVFVVYHLMHFTWGNVHPDFEHGKVYANVVKGFQSTGVVLFYVVAMLALGLHLAHGLWSLFQTLGLNAPRCDCKLRTLAILATVAVVGGFIAVPVAVMAGILTLGGGG